MFWDTKTLGRGQEKIVASVNIGEKNKDKTVGLVSCFKSVLKEKSGIFQPSVFPVNVAIVTLWVMLTLHSSPPL